MQMMPENSQSRPPRPLVSRIVRAALGLCAYALAVFGLSVVCHRFHLDEVIVVPLVAELLLIKSNWTNCSFWKGLAGRLAGLALGNSLAYHLYLVPLIYRGAEPWPEEATWGYLCCALQTLVAAVAFSIARRLRHP
jgi:hypothetical protein